MNSECTPLPMVRRLVHSFLIVFATWIAVVCGAARLQAASPIIDPDLGLGITIWADHFRDGQECRFVRSFTIPSGAKVRSARLRITADNSFEVFLDGQPIGQGSDWRVLTEYELRLLLHPGEHLLAVSARSSKRPRPLPLRH